MSKYCPQCKQILPNSEFYKNRTIRDGLSSVCKYHAKIATKKYRQSDKGRLAACETNKKYLQSEKGKLTRYKAQKKHRKTEYVKQIRTIEASLQYAIRSGVLQRDICALCGDENTQIHHPNYEVPNNIYWLCYRHHLEQHGKIKRS